MTRALAGVSVTRQNSDNIVKFLDGTASFDDVIFDLMEDGNVSPVNCHDSGDYDDDESPCNVEQNKAFWGKQEQLLEGTLFRTTPIEAKIRQFTKETLLEVESVGLQCICRKPVSGGCRDCLRGAIATRLQNAGFNSMICRSKWRNSSEFIAGEHSYLEVVDNSSSKKGEIRVVIELNFRGEFEMAKGSEEYNKLVQKLPKVFVGKAERLKSLIKILCDAAKKCMKEKKMHIAPWRKHKYMQTKWFGTCERTTPPQPFTVDFSHRREKSRTSMLTSDLLENLPLLHCPVVSVV